MLEGVYGRREEARVVGWGEEARWNAVPEALQAEEGPWTPGQEARRQRAAR